MTEPKFSVGERVQVVHVDGTILVNDDIITSREWCHPSTHYNKNTGNDMREGWWYSVTTKHPLANHEDRLRRRPDPGTDWETLKAQLKRGQGVDA